MTEQTTAIAKAQQPKSIIAKLAGMYDMEPSAFAATVKATVFPGGNATNEQLAAYLLVCDTYRLNPVLKQIHAFPAKSGGVQPIMGIDGFLAVANAHKEFNGLRHRYEVSEKGELLGVTCIVHRKDREHPIEITEWMDECKRGTEPWRNMPRRMLRNRATCQALRHAFSIGGVMEDDEAEAMVERQVTEAAPTPTNLRALTEKFSPPSKMESRPEDPFADQPEQSTGMSAEENAAEDARIAAEEHAREQRETKEQADALFGNEPPKKGRASKEH